MKKEKCQPAQGSADGVFYWKNRVTETEKVPADYIMMQGMMVGTH